MTNHLHLLVTPESKEKLAIFMQTMANRYVRYYNALHKRTGTIWEGRYKSCLVDADSYLFTLYKYIEMNPVKANMVADISEYPWSSYSYNALGMPDELITEHVLYTGICEKEELRCSRYIEMFNQLNINKQRKDIVKATLAGEVYGTDSFHSKISKLINRVTRLSSHGGDRKSEAYKKNQAG